MRVEMRSSTSCRQARPVGRHRVLRIHHAHSDRVSVGAAVSHHPDAAHRQQHRESLPDFLVKPGAPNFFHHHGVRAAQRFEPFPRDFPQQTHRQARPGKRMLHQDFFGQAQFPADLPNFILEKIPQRLDQAERACFPADRRHCDAI